MPVKPVYSAENSQKGKMCGNRAEKGAEKPKSSGEIIVYLQ